MISIWLFFRTGAPHSAYLYVTENETPQAMTTTRTTRTTPEKTVKTTAPQGRKKGFIRPETEKISILDRINERILQQMEQGVIPWRKPWKVLLDGTADVARNYVTKKAYRGINTMLLTWSGDERPFFLTYKQATDLGGQVRKGAKGQFIVYYKITKKEDLTTGQEKKLFYEQISYVFNVSQIDGVDFDLPATVIPEPTPAGMKIPACEVLISGFADCPEIVFNNPERACYYPLWDKVNMPRLEAFHSPEEYYKTLFHELAHSTGHPDRLKREDLGAGRMGSKAYSREELTAEMASNSLLIYSGISMPDDSAMFKNTASYIKGYLACLKDDKQLFYNAARTAQKSHDYILGLIPGHGTEADAGATATAG